MCPGDCLCLCFIAFIGFILFYGLYRSIRECFSDKITSEAIAKSADVLNLQDLGFAKGERIWDANFDAPSSYIVVEKRHAPLRCLARVRIGTDKTTKQVVRFCPKCAIVLSGEDVEEDYGEGSGFSGCPGTPPGEDAEDGYGKGSSFRDCRGTPQTSSGAANGRGVFKEYKHESITGRCGSSRVQFQWGHLRDHWSEARGLAQGSGRTGQRRR